VTDEFGPVRVLIERAPFRVGVLARSADGETLFEHDADSAYPSASVIKVPLMMTLCADAADSVTVKGIGVVGLQSVLPSMTLESAIDKLGGLVTVSVPAV